MTVDVIKEMHDLSKFFLRAEIIERLKTRSCEREQFSLLSLLVTRSCACSYSVIRREGVAISFEQALNARDGRVY